MTQLTKRGLAVSKTHEDENIMVNMRVEGVGGRWFAPTHINRNALGNSFSECLNRRGGYLTGSHV